MAHLPPDESIEILYVIVILFVQPIQSSCQAFQMSRARMLQHLQS